MEKSGRIMKFKHSEADPLVELCRQGDRMAQSELFRKYSKSMLNTAYRILNNQEDAKDVLQESFVKAFSQLHTFQYRSTFGAWFKRIVINIALNFRKKNSDQFKDDLEVLENVSADAQEELEEPMLIRNPEAVRNCLMSLPQGYRTILSLYLLEGYDHEEISEILGISKSTSLSQYHRGKKKLCELIKNYRLDGSN